MSCLPCGFPHQTRNKQSLASAHTGGHKGWPDSRNRNRLVCTVRAADNPAMRQGKPTTYVGIDKDLDGGMTDTGRIIRDAWAFGLIPETETCAGWNAAAIEKLWEQTLAEWDRYQHQVSLLPDDIRERYLRIQQAAVERARKAGWQVDLSNED